MAGARMDGPGDRGQREATSGLKSRDTASSGVQPQGNYEEAEAEIDFLVDVQHAERENEQFLAALQRTAWQRTLRAYRNQHQVGSKYDSPPYRNRSKIFRPKTRTAVRKNLASTAAALFSNNDVVEIRAERDTDPVKNVSAGVLKEIMNYRLDRTATKAGIPWFIMAIGACMDAQLQGVCVSKQYWDYRVSVENYEVDVEDEIEEQVIDEATGFPMFNADGTPITTTRMEQRTEMREERYIVADRPMIETLPPENVMIDPAAPWYAPAQESDYLVIKYPMSVEAAWTFLNSPGKHGEKEWIKITQEELEKHATEYHSKGVRVERSGGVDRFEAGKNSGVNKTVWLYECFVRKDGVDYHFWSLGCEKYLSKVRTTRQVYPEQMGDRPVTYGYGQLESHNIAPMSMADSIYPLQNEANDLVNLRLDTAKQALSPIAKVRQGTVFDWKQLQHRGGPDTTVIVKNVNDLEFDRTPGPDSSSYQEMNLLNVDMDELSGSFAGSSVQANRQLNETVGGMRMLSGSANAVTEYDVRVFVETWAEPALRQATRCSQYYEDDETILALAGERAAKIFERFGVSEITDHDLETEVSVSINVGIGAADPMQKLTKFSMAMQTTAQAAPFMDKKPKLKSEEFIKEVFGNAGYNDGMRFFAFDEEGGGDMPPEMIEAQFKAQLEQMKAENELLISREKNATELQKIEAKGRIDLIDRLIQEIAGEEKFEAEQSMAEAMNATGTIADLVRDFMGQQHQSREAAANRSAQERESAANRDAQERQARMRPQ